MYRYDEFDHKLVKQRVAQFEGQVKRRLAGELTEDQFKPLRLMNGLYLQLHAYMLRVAIPYGTLSSRQMRRLAHIAREFDKGYGHFTTRQNIQYNWIKLEQTPQLLSSLAEVEMHAMQTSGNCIRNITSDQYAGVGIDEVEDPRIWCEIIRQWSTLHPEFSYLPRKFKIAVTASLKDRAAIQLHDIGLAMVRHGDGDTGFTVYVGGGQGRTPMLGKKIADFVKKQDILAYLEAIMRVYNLHGQRDNLYKARIKILVHKLGAEEMRRQVEDIFAALRQKETLRPAKEEINRISAYFAPPSYQTLPEKSAALEEASAHNKDLAQWVYANTAPHRVQGYTIATISLKPIGGIPGDASAEQMEAIAAMAETYSYGEIRVTHSQNLVLPNVRKDDIPALHQKLKDTGLATANLDMISDIIACPGLDYCNLANTRSIPIAQKISNRFSSLTQQYDIGEMKIKISGCINACGHHHVGHIGILGVDKKGTEYYQISLGGSEDEKASLATIVGPAFTEDAAVNAVETLINTYLDLREDTKESFLAAYRRVGIQPFKDALYGSH